MQHNDFPMNICFKTYGLKPIAIVNFKYKSIKTEIKIAMNNIVIVILHLTYSNKIILQCLQFVAKVFRLNVFSYHNIKLKTILK